MMTGIFPVARTLVVAGDSYYRRQLGFLRFGEYAGRLSQSARHTRHFAISNPHLPAGERNDVEGERNEVLNSLLSGAEEHEIEAGVEEADEEIDKEVEDDGFAVSVIQENFPSAVFREI